MFKPPLYSFAMAKAMYNAFRTGKVLKDSEIDISQNCIAQVLVNHHQV